MLTNILWATAFIAGTSAVSVAAYLIAQKYTPARRDQHRDMATAMVSRIGALHGLILALVFAQEMAAYQRLEAQVAVEASAVADVYNDAARYQDPNTTIIRRQMLTYLEIVLDDEWTSLGKGLGLSAAAWSVWDVAYQQVLDLEPTGARQQDLRQHMLTRLHDVSSSRDLRAAEAGTSIANFFWFAALSGVVLIAVGHYIYAANRQSVTLLVLFSAYTGLILFLIYGLANPFSEPTALAPVPLVNLAEALDLEIGER